MKMKYWTKELNTWMAHKVFHIKGGVIWALGPNAKHEIMRSRWGRELKDVNLPEILKLFKKTFLPAEMYSIAVPNSSTQNK